MSEFRDKVSKVLDIRVLNKSDWHRIFSQLDNEGKPDRRTMTHLAEVICEALDKMMEDLEELKEERYEAAGRSR